MIEPPVWVATLSGTIRAATLTAEPLDEPLAVRERSHGLQVGEGSRPANWVVCTLPRMMAPASRSPAMHVASTPGSRSRNGSKLAQVGSPRVKMRSLTEIGMPQSGPAVPSRQARSA
jgi:hypothetical protein